MSVSMKGQTGPDKGWELSFYDLQRTPQKAITDQTEIAVSPRSLQNELKCSICLNMLKRTVTAKECLHRFCSKCIYTALDSGKHKCPICQKKLVTKESLLPDPNFDLLIDKIYPERNPVSQKRVMAKAKFPLSIRVPTTYISKESDRHSPSPDSTATFVESHIEVIFRPHPSEMFTDPLLTTLKDSMRYIQTPDHATIDHLSKYLAMRLTLDNLDCDNSDNLGLVNFCIYIAPSPGQLILLESNQTMKQVSEKYWKSDEPLEMYYSISRKT